MRIRTSLTILTLTLSLFALSACSGSDSSASPKFNDTDVSFAQDMIPHHRQATQMAGLAEERSENSVILRLAQQIIAAQKPEITLMSKWLQSWGEEVPQDMSTMSGMADSTMPGMMTSAELDSLKALSGSKFDEQFLTMMIRHHEGAMEMSRVEEANGLYPHAVRMAGRIQRDQAVEIRTMESLRNS